MCQFLVLAGNWQFFCCGGKFSLPPEKKDTLRPEKKGAVVCLMGAQFWRLGPEKKDTDVCLAGCAVVLCQFLVLAGNWQFFCCGGKFLLRLEKHFFVVAGNFDYDRKKKRYSRLLVGN